MLPARKARAGSDCRAWISCPRLVGLRPTVAWRPFSDKDRRPLSGRLLGAERTRGVHACNPQRCCRQSLLVAISQSPFGCFAPASLLSNQGWPLPSVIIVDQNGRYVWLTLKAHHLRTKSGWRAKKLRLAGVRAIWTPFPISALVFSPGVRSPGVRSPGGRRCVLVIPPTSRIIGPSATGRRSAGECSAA